MIMIHVNQGQENIYWCI